MQKKNAFTSDIHMQDTEEEEPAATAWRRAILSPTLILDLVVCGLIGGLPEILPQNRRRTPVTSSGREFMLDSPYMADTVPNWALLITATLLPLLVAIGLSVIVPTRGAVKAWLHSWLYTMGTQLLIIGSLKAYCGYWRPYFLEECAYNTTLNACTSSSYDHAFRSFPSGHAATSVAMLVHTSLRLLGALRVGTVPRVCRLGTFTYLELDGVLTLCCLLPIFLSVWIAASRVYDNAHHPADVVGGALVGGATATLWYFRYFHGLFGPRSHMPRHSPQPLPPLQGHGHGQRRASPSERE